MVTLEKRQAEIVCHWYFFFLLAGTRCPNKGQDWFEQEDRSLFVQKSHESILIASKVPDVPKSFDPQRGNNEFVF